MPCDLYIQYLQHVVQLSVGTIFDQSDFSITSCDFLSGCQGQPKLARSDTNNCSYGVTFVTPDACKISQTVQGNDVTKTNCVFKVSEGIELNFTPLPKSVS